MAEYIERTEELVLAMNAGASASEHIWRHHSAVYTKNFLSDNSQEISYLLAAKVLLKVSDAPAADVAPVRHGQWIVRFDGPYNRRRYYCSHCGKHNGVGGIAQNQEKPYCPNCGAKMDGQILAGEEND